MKNENVLKQGRSVFVRRTIFIIIGSVVIAGAVVTGGLYTYKALTKDPVSIIESTSGYAKDTDKNNKFIEIKEVDAEPVEEEFPVDISEEAVQHAIHSMSHQKVKADKKWGFLPMTQERIQRLTEVVKQKDYKHGKLYLDILEGWSQSDFSDADADHNAIWDLQGGTIGEATGVLSLEEEKAFIEKYYDIE